MKTIASGLLTIALFAATAACDGAPTAPQARSSAADGASLVQSPGVLAFTHTRSSGERTPQTASGGPASIGFTGSLATGQPCYVVTGAHSTRNDSVTLTVTATRTGDVCYQVVTYHNYQGSVAGLTPGTYTFTVVHSVNGTSTTAYTGTVVVQ
jgi:hypothetical protein